MSEMALQLILQAKAEGWKTLDLGSTGIVGEVPVKIWELTELEELVLSDTWRDKVKGLQKSQNTGQDNKIDSFPVCPTLPISGMADEEIIQHRGLARLKKLVLTNSKIADIQPLALVSNLQTLHLDNTQVADIQPLAQLRYLDTLYLDQTQVSNIQPLAQLSFLHTLYLHNTLVANIQPLAQLKNLQTLYLYNTKVADIQPLAHSNSLQTLSLYKTLVANIQPLANHSNLKELYLHCTHVGDIQPLGYLSKLRTLDLSETHVADIQPIQSRLKVGLNLNIENCPITNPPYEIAIQGNKAILNYWAEKDRVKAFPLKELKLFLLGNSTAGKSTLREALITNLYDEKITTTHGADLSKVWPDQENTINIWDFGGQEYFHATYHLLMNDDAVYVLLIDPKHNQDNFQPTPVSYDPQAPKEEEDLEHFHHRYWMETIHARAPKSDVLVVWNKLELKDRKQGTFSEADKKGRDAEQFQEFRLGIRAAIRDKDRSWLNHWGTFTHALKQQIQAKLQGKEVLSYWPNVRKAVEAQAQHDIRISRTEFDALVRKGDPLRDVELCIIYLRDICGSILYWGDHPDLKDVVFIHPNRINRLIYSVLSREIKQGGGQFDHAWATKQVAKTLPEFDPARNVPNEEVERLTNELIEVMLLFRIIFEIKAKPRQASELPRYIAPQYLPAAPPRALSEEKQWDRISPEPQFWIKFEGYLPRHVFPCMVAEKGPLASHRLYWKTGILFSLAENEGVKALVEVDYQARVISISSNVVHNCAAKLCGIFHDLLEIISDGTPISISLDGQTYRPYSRLEKAYRAGLPKVENESGDFEAWGDLKKWMPDVLRQTSPTRRKPSEKSPKGRMPASLHPDLLKMLLEKIAELMEKVEALSQQNQQTHIQLAEINGLLHSYFDIFLEKISDLQDEQGHLRSDLQSMLNRLNDKADLAEGLLQHLIQHKDELNLAIQQGLKALPPAQQQAIQALQPAKESPLWLDAAKAIKLKLSTLTLVAAALAATTPAGPVALPALLAASTINVEATLPEALRGVWKVLRKIAEPFRLDGH